MIKVMFKFSGTTRITGSGATTLSPKKVVKFRFLPPRGDDRGGISVRVQGLFWLRDQQKK